MDKDILLETVEKLTDENLWKAHGLIIKELKIRKLVRTRNIAGERGEQIAIDIYHNTPNEPKLQAAPAGTQNVDALSRKGERYAIKTVTLPRKLTGVFYGLNPPGSKEQEEKKFEHLIIAMINESFEPVEILECTWETFLKHKRWHKTMRAWNISVTSAFERDSRVVYKNKSGEIC
jgi:hypothetical protein